MRPKRNRFMIEMEPEHPDNYLNECETTTDVWYTIQLYRLL
jgi:hypothetical protein